MEPIKPILPMEPKSSNQIPSGNNWIAQVKWDGVRMLTYCEQDDVRLFNRRQRERTHHYPEISDIRSYCHAKSVVLDGEAIALGGEGKPSFHEIMRRDGIRRMDRVALMQREVPVIYMIFDVVYLNGEWLDRHPLEYRLELLTKIIEPSPRIQLVPSHSEGQALFSVMVQQGMEGIVCKKTDSYYWMGEKKDCWLKIKNYQDLIAVVGGFTESDGIANSILLGLYNESGQFIYIGHSGTGKLTHSEWREVTEKLRSIIRSERPFANQPERYRDAIWVNPLLTVKLKFAEWTEGHLLRQPSIQSFVTVSPNECRL